MVGTRLAEDGLVRPVHSDPDRLESAGERPEALALLATAVSGRALRVAHGEPGQPAWTDGHAIFVDPGESAARSVEAVAVQAALLAAGSLEPQLVRALKRHRGLALCYLAIEGHRALLEVEALLPPVVHGLINTQLAESVDSPWASLAAARAKGKNLSAPPSFGTIQPKELLASMVHAERSASVSEQGAGGAQKRPTAELEACGDDELAAEGSVLDFFTAAGAQGSMLERLFSKVTTAVRRLHSDGSPGPVAPTHRAGSGKLGAHGFSATMRGADALDEAGREGTGLTYPEWDVHLRSYRKDWCTVKEIEQPLIANAAPSSPEDHGMRRPLARLGLGLDRHRRQTFGDDIDIDRVVASQIEIKAGFAGDEGYYISSLRRRRDLSVMLLLDISGSAAEPCLGGDGDKTVHDQQRAVAASLLTALHDLGDRVALYGFRSQGRSQVHLVPVKRFDQPLNGAVMRCLDSLVPGMYSRLGAAIRHGAAVLKARGGTSRQLLVVLSDGLAYDHGYESAYGSADARKALGEARRQGIGCLCLGVGSSTDAETMRRVFGSAAHATVVNPSQVGRLIGPMFRMALRSAEVFREVSA